MSEQVVVLTGGVGGAKLVLGLTKLMPPESIVAIVNTGDDFDHLGLAVSPDLDTLLYTLAGKANARQGWGREDETFGFMDAMRSLGGADWFLLGDGDLALHVLRTHWCASGATLGEIIRRFAESWSVRTKILPMSDDPVATHLYTDEGELAFQEYFVALRCRPVVKEIIFRGHENAKAGPGTVEAIIDQRTRAILIAPSNPWLSIDPILAVPGIRDALRAATAPVVAISPIIGGQAVKGPTTKIMAELGLDATNTNIDRHYAGLLDGLVIDGRDSPAGLQVPYIATDTLMTTLADRARVAQVALDFAARLAG